VSTVLVGSFQANRRFLSLSDPAPWQALTAALLAAAFGIGLVVSVPDVTWLQIAAERAMHGQRLYTQVLEVNPPLSVFIYAPALLLAGWLDVPPEAVTAGLCVLAAVVSLGLSGAILRPLIGNDLRRGWRLAAAGAFVLGVMPAAAFGQREHLAVIALLPFVSTTVVRAAGRPPPWLMAVGAGLGLGVAVALKPHFAAIAALPALWAWSCSRRPPPSQPEYWTGGLVFCGYAVAVVAWFPDYASQIAPLLREAYLPIRAPLWQLLTLAALPLALGSALVARMARLDGRLLAAPLLAALGGAAAFLVQGKGWPYHAYPMLAFAALGLWGAAALAPPARVRGWTRIDRAMLLVPPLVATAWLAANVDSAALSRTVAAVGPVSPSMIAVSGNLGVGMPIVRALHARWVGSEPSQWISDGVLRREESERLTPTQRSRLDALMGSERSRLGRDIRVGQPDVVLFDRKRFDWRAWALKDPEVADALRGYRFAGAAHKVEVWTRSAAGR
jgi:hypothetical protein